MKLLLILLLSISCKRNNHLYHYYIISCTSRGDDMVGRGERFNTTVFLGWGVDLWAAKITR